MGSVEMKCDNLPKCGESGLAGCDNLATRKATFTDKVTGEKSVAYYCEIDYHEAYDLRSLGLKVRVQKV